LFECSPSGIAYDYLANAIGARSQSARTYLEKYVDEFADASLDTLILHGLRALRDTLQQNKELDMQNTSIAIVGKDYSFTILEGDALKNHLNALEADSGLARRIGGAPAATQPESAAMDTAE
jgi:20S proteasome subunit alpha 6